jgi:hypothetical protein
MNSSPVSDSSAAANAAVASNVLGFQNPAPEDGAETFGNLLAQVVEQNDPDESDPVEATTFPIESEEEKEPDPVLISAPLIFFSPPPEIKPLPTPEVEVSAPEIEPELSVCNAPVPTEQKADSTQVVESVRPKDEKALDDAKAAKPTLTKSEEKSEKLPLKGLESITSKETQLLEIEQVKRPELPPQAAPAPSGGTVAAKQANAMENSQKSAEIAPTIEQKMPVGEHSRRALPVEARFETAGFIANTFDGAKSEFSIEAPAPEISTRPLEAAELVETIRTEVANLRQRGDATMTLALRPDNGTELKLEMRVARDGTIHASVRCERGDFQTLNAQWPHLQQSLAAQGIRVNDLANPGQSQNHHNHDSSHAQNFDRGNNSQHRQQQPGADFEEELAASTPRYPTNNSFKTAAAPSRRWQSWA